VLTVTMYERRFLEFADVILTQHWTALLI
jgi:hypothetical protein